MNDGIFRKREKPRLSISAGVWMCRGEGKLCFGQTPAAAYWAWKSTGYALAPTLPTLLDWPHRVIRLGPHQ